MPAPSELPRWSLAILSGIAGSILAWGAWTLPWQQWTTFSIIVGLAAAAHLPTTVAAAAGRPSRGRFWRTQSMAGLGLLAYLTWNALTSASYVSALYGGLGKGIAAALMVVWTPVAFLTVPLAVWGIVATGGVRSRRRASIGAGAIALLCAFGLTAASSAPAADPTPAASAEVLEATLATLPAPADRPAPTRSASLFIDEPAQCPGPVTSETVTAIATYLEAGVAGRAQPTTVCRQGPEVESTVAALTEELRGAALQGPIKVDVITAVQPLSTIAPVVDGLALRPGLDGVCEGERCLMPWQLIAHDQFTVYRPIRLIAELRFGVEAGSLRRLLTPPGQRARHFSTALDGLLRIETASFIFDQAGQLHRLRRMRAEDGPLDPDELRRAKAAAEAYVLDAQGQDGRFFYMVNPFTGQVSYRGFSVPRQAGTTLALCELSERNERSRKVIEDALSMLASLERQRGDVGALHFPPQAPVEKVRLGPSALSLIALLRCRDRVGDRFDPVIARLGRLIVGMQRPDGGFYPAYDVQARVPLEGPDLLYAAGQAVFGLSLLEKLLADGPLVGFDDHATVRDTVERAMTYFATDYWNYFLSNFIFLEENWHCLAARASLQHHRHDGYEKFCLDYITYKSRLILDDESGVDRDLVGGYGFGNVLLPHNTGSSGFGEACSAALEVARARGEDTARFERPLRLVLRFLLHHQWDDANCFACSLDKKVPGAFSEHMASPNIRIDYVQHAMAAMGHGGRALGLLQ